MKWTDRTSVEEVIAMQMVRTAGIPVPRVISCGEHPNDTFNMKVSILMARLPGVTLENSRDQLQVDAEDTWLEELKTCVSSMRLWHPLSPRSICSPIGTSLRTIRVPDHIMGPFSDATGLYSHLFYSSSAHGFKSATEYEETLSCKETTTP